MKFTMLVTFFLFSFNVFAAQPSPKQLINFLSENSNLFESFKLTSIKNSEDFIQKFDNRDFAELIERAKRLEENAEVRLVCWK